MVTLDDISVSIKRVSVCTAVLLLAGCATWGPAPEPDRPPEPVVVIEPPPVVIQVEPEAEPQVAVVEPAVFVPPPLVAIVMSSRQPAYENVAVALSRQLENYDIYDLGDKSQPPVNAFRQIADTETVAVVAIGLRAALSATSMSDVPVVFCQVFNVRDNELLGDNSRGVASLPPLDLQIAGWKKLDPSLRSIGAIIGEGHEDLIEEAELAAAKHGIELQFKVARSDRETLYLFNRLAGQIDGFWLFPDNRILSASVLKEILGYAASHQVQVAVFNDSLLDMGAALSSTTVDADIAATIVELLDEIQAGRIDELEEISPLSDVRIETNEELMEQLSKDKPSAISDATLASGQ